jgi:hypothetical protein
MKLQTLGSEVPLSSGSYGHPQQETTYDDTCLNMDPDSEFSGRYNTGNVTGGGAPLSIEDYGHGTVITGARI